MTRLSILASSFALLLAAIAGQNTLLAHGQTAPAGTVAKPQIGSYAVLRGGCGSGDLYVLRYTPAGDSREAVASWCS